jgi:hypothetical protein
LLELRANFLLTTFKQMHGDMRSLIAFQANLGFADFFDLIGRQQPHSVNQRKFSHGETIVARLVRYDNQQ